MIRKAIILALVVIFTVLLAVVPKPLSAASEPMKAAPASGPPVIDGSLDDPAWGRAVAFTGFVTAKPDFGKPASERTEAFFTYDARNLYFGFRCFDAEPGKIKAAVSKRDDLGKDDGVALLLDMAGDGQGGYIFICNPLGIQMDGTVDSEGTIDTSLDLVWTSRGRTTPDGYEVEAAVPLKSLRFPGRPEMTIGLTAYRYIGRKSEESYCPEYRPGSGSLLSQVRRVTLSGVAFVRPVELLPAMTIRRSRTRGAGAWGRPGGQADLGLTGKVGLTSDLTLDAAVNPDFSQVEADAGQIDVNLRYALYYPEKRPFFLEGMEDFSFAGAMEQNPLLALVHTRTIVDPAFGFKLTGKVGAKDRVSSILSLDRYPGQAAASAGQPGADRDAWFGILRYKHLLAGDAYVGAFGTAREWNGDGNEVSGMDAKFRLSPRTTLEGFAFGSRSRDGGTRRAGEALGLKFSYQSRRSSVVLGACDIGKDFRTEAGFLTRTGVRMVSGLATYRIFPASKAVGRVEPYYWFTQTYDVPSGLFESQNYFALRVLMPRQTMVRLMAVAANEVYSGRRFRKDGWWIKAESQVLKRLAVEADVMNTGAIFYDPKAPFQGRSTRGSAGVSFQPSDRLTTGLDLSYYDFHRATDGRQIQDYTIVRSRTVFQVNRFLFFRGIFEYNTWYRRLTSDLLASFTWIPGTVLYVGYGGTYDRMRWSPEGASWLPDDRFRQVRRDFFFKASYLWRF